MADHNFISKHIQIIDSQRTKTKPTLPLLSRDSVIPTLALLWALLALFLSLKGPECLLRLFDMITRGPTHFEFLVSPTRGVTTSLTGVKELLFPVLLIPLMYIIPALQAWALRGKNEQAVFYLFTKRLYSDAEYEFDGNYPKLEQGRTEALEKRLEKLLKKRIFDPTKDYTFEELTKIITQTAFAPRRHLAVASTLLVFSFLVIISFNFVRISGDKISYSALNSFVIKTADVSDVSDVTFYCKKRIRSKGLSKPRRLILAVELNNGFHFEVREGNEHLGPILSKFEITDSALVKAQKECREVRYQRDRLQEYVEPYSL